MKYALRIRNYEMYEYVKKNMDTLEKKHNETKHLQLDLYRYKHLNHN